jgi:hypothetical protein
VSAGRIIPTCAGRKIPRWADGLSLRILASSRC